MVIITAHTGIKISITQLQNVRSNAEKDFDSIFIKVVEMVNNCGTTIQIKRKCQQQTNRENCDGEQKDFSCYSYHIYIISFHNLKACYIK